MMVVMRVFFYWGSWESWMGLPMMMHFFEVWCYFYMKRLIIGILERRDVMEVSCWERAFEWAI
jgi:hypothetical protein